MSDVDLELEMQNAVGNRVPGIVVVVVGAEGVRRRSAWGLADAVSRTLMRLDDAFPWFSMTEIATATTALRLVERRALELDAPVSPLVSVMRLLKPAAWTSCVKLRVW
jgi:CubicO group peptidase (beta-lactamase class C family)